MDRRSLAFRRGLVFLAIPASTMSLIIVSDPVNVDIFCSSFCRSPCTRVSLPFASLSWAWTSAIVSELCSIEPLAALSRFGSEDRQLPPSVTNLLEESVWGDGSGKKDFPGISARGDSGDEGTLCVAIVYDQ